MPLSTLPCLLLLLLLLLLATLPCFACLPAPMVLLYVYYGMASSRQQQGLARRASTHLCFFPGHPKARQRGPCPDPRRSAGGSLSPARASICMYLRPLWVIQAVSWGV